MELPAVAVVHDADGVAPRALAAAARDLCRLVWLVDGPQRLERFGTVVDVHGQPGADVTATCVRLGVVGVLATSDAPLRYAAGLAAVLGLPGQLPAAAALLADLGDQRRRLVAAGVPCLDAGELPPGPRSRRGFGAQGVPPGPRSPAAANSRSSDVVSIECAVLPGATQVLVLAVCGRFAAGPADTNVFVPAAAHADQDLEAVALRAVRALGLGPGVCSVEVRSAGDGPRVLRVRGRVGSNVPPVLAAAGGGDVLQTALLLALDRTPIPLPTARRVGFTFLEGPLDDGVAAAVLALPGITDVSPHGAITGCAPDHASMFAIHAGVQRLLSAAAGG